MTPYPSVSVLIIDRSQTWGSDLRTRLATLDVHIQVVSTQTAALKFARNKRIDVAVLEFDTDSWTKDVCAGLKSCGSPFVYMAPHPMGATGAARLQPGHVIALAGAETVLN